MHHNYDDPTSLWNEHDLTPEVSALEPSATLWINERSADLISQGKDVYRLGLGQSPFPVPTYVARALAEHAAEKDYLPVLGLPELRHAVVSRLFRNEGIQRHAHDVIIGPGSKELIYMVQLALQARLLLPSPSWVSYAPQARLLKRDISWINTLWTDGLKLQADQLEQYCQTHNDERLILLLNTPNNPTGSCYQEEELIALTQVLRTYQVLVISDEIYSGTHFTGSHVSIARFYPEGTIISDGISKWAGAGGWRLGFMSLPSNLSWLTEALGRIASETFTSVSAPIQYAAIKAVDPHPEMQNYLENSRLILGALTSYTVRLLRAHGLQSTDAGGGFYLFISFEAFRKQLETQGIHTGQEVARKLLDEVGVAALEGAHFGRSQRELSLRIALVDFDGDTALQAINATQQSELNDEFLSTYCPKVIEAVNLICSWCQDLLTPSDHPN